MTFKIFSVPAARRDDARLVFICPKIVHIYLTNIKIALFLKNNAVNIW